MGRNAELLTVAQAIIESIQPTPDQEFQCKMTSPKTTILLHALIPLKVSDDVLSKLAFIFPENLILAALDLIDRDNGEKFQFACIDKLFTPSGFQ